MKRLLLVVAFLLWASVAHATTYYVRTTGSDANCNGTVNVADSVGVRPNCAEATITAAAADALNGDDIIHIGAGTWNENVIIPRGGTSGHPIIYEGEGTLGANTTWKHTGADNDSLTLGAMYIVDKSYLTFRTIKFDGTTEKATIYIFANTVDSNNITFDSCTFSNNGNRGFDLDATTGFARTIYFNATSPKNHNNHSITNSTWTGNYGLAIQLLRAHGCTISGNTVSGQKSSQSSSSDGYIYEAKFVHRGQGGASNTFDSNTVHDFVKDSYIPSNTTGTHCGATCQYTATAFRGDTSASSDTISNNTIYNIDSANAGGQGYGIYYESDCNNNIALNNIIYNIGHNGIHWGSPSTNINSGNIADGNTIYNCTCNGIRWAKSSSGTQKNNIIYAVGSGQVASSDSDLSSGISYSHNLYYHTAGTNINGWNTTSANQCTSNVTYATWIDGSHANESGGVNSDPLFVSLVTPDFHLQGGSPGKLAGTTGQDMGAYPGDITPPPPATISITYPNGGENLTVGTSINILWETTQSGNCTVSLTREGRTETISASTTCTAQTQAWTVTAPARVSNARFVVTSISDPTVTGTSDADNNILGTLLK